MMASLPLTTTSSPSLLVDVEEYPLKEKSSLPINNPNPTLSVTLPWNGKEKEEDQIQIQQQQNNHLDHRSMKENETTFNDNIFQVQRNFESPKAHNLRFLSHILPEFNTTKVGSQDERNDEMEGKAKKMLEDVVSCLSSTVNQSPVVLDEQELDDKLLSLEIQQSDPFSNDHIDNSLKRTSASPDKISANQQDSVLQGRNATKSQSFNMTDSPSKTVHNNNTSMNNHSDFSSPLSATMSKFASYKIEKKIGEGSFSKVKMATHMLSGEKVAIKCLDKRKMNSVIGTSERILREIYILSNLDHPYICPLLQVEESASSIYLVMDYSSRGDLVDYIKTNSLPHQGLKESVAKEFFVKILSALKFCHDHDIVHRDLKPDNILLNDNLDPQLIDFGFANLVRNQKFLETACGTLAYSPPEMIARKAYDGKAADAWSLGILLYTMVCGRLPFDEATEGKTVTKIITGKYTIPEYVSHFCKQVIEGLLKVRPMERLTLAQVCELSWIKEDIQELFDKIHSKRKSWHVVHHSENQKSQSDSIHDASMNQINELILEQMVTFGMDKQEILKSLNVSRPGFLAATYKILLKKHFTK